MIKTNRSGIRTIGCILLALLVAAAAFVPRAARAEAEAAVTLLFTTDIHSNDVPHLAMHDGQGARLGGFARLKTAVDQNTVEGKTLLLDSGDFSMGTLYQNYTQSDALELTLMDGIGYDAVALGNHDFELGEEGLKSELDLFRANGGGMALLASNLTGGDGKVTAEQNDNPLYAQGVQNYVIFERNGVRIGVFSLMGYDAISYTPTETLSFSDPIKSAKAIVDHLRNEEKVDMVVALSHAGTMPDGSFTEDADIAKAVDGIDVILSGHEHVPTPQIIAVNDTMIVCAGTALNYLGRLDLTRSAGGSGAWSGEYKLIPLGDDIAEDAQVAQTLAGYTARIDSDYLAPMGVTESAMADFAVTDYDFIDGDNMCLTFKNYAFGSLISDAYFDGLEKAGVADVAAVAIPTGFVRNGLYRGTLQVMDVYNVLSYGISPLDGSSGAPICVFYLTGSEIYNLCETSASLSGIMNTVQMLIGGMRFDYSDSRLILNKVYNVELLDRSTGVYEPVARDNSRLYKVAASWTALQNLSLLGEKSFGLVTIEPKDANGVILKTEELPSTVVLRQDGSELKEWYTLYGYMDSMPKNGDGLSVVDSHYAEEPAYMAEHSGGIGLFFTNPSKAFLIICGILLALILIIALLIILIVKLVKRARKRKGGGQGSPKRAANALSCLMLISMLLVLCMGCASAPVSASDPLPSWKNGAAKSQIIDFVTAAVTPGGEGFIPVEDRIVVSDMDGTLICETGGDDANEYVEIELIRALIESERNSKSVEDAAARAALSIYDAAMDAEQSGGGLSAPQLDNTKVKEYYYDLVGRAFCGMTNEQLQPALMRQLDKPFSNGRSFRKVLYAPMLELYHYLCDNDFTFYVVSGSNCNVIYAACCDAFARDGEPFPYSRCLGAALETELSKDGKNVVFTEEIDKLNVNALKCTCIAQEIGQMPVLALGNSTGDVEMLSWTLSNPEYPTLAVLVNHDDAQRESAYRADDLRALCSEKGYLCVSMKDDFASVYSD